MTTCTQCLTPVDTTTDHEFHDKDVNGNRDVCVKCRDSNWREEMILQSPLHRDSGGKSKDAWAMIDSGMRGNDFK